MDPSVMNTIRSTISISMLLLGAQSIHALSEPADPPGNQQQVDEAESILPRVGTNETPVMPTVPAVSIAQQPGLSEGQDWLKVLHESLEQSIAPSTLAEGAFILNRLGNIVRGPGELLIFVPDKATKLPGEGPVLLMPCRTLEQLEAEWTGQPIELSGEIFDYHNRNQLLISAYRLSSVPIEPEKTDTPEGNPSSEQPASEPPSSLEDDPDVRDLLDELEFGSTPPTDDPKSVHKKLDATPTQNTRRPQVTLPESQGGLDEGTLILRQPARMIRNANGAWTIIFDHDNTASIDSIELIVEPSRMLMRMERIAMESGDAAQLLISGRVYTYKGAHYILPTLMQQRRPQEINSLQ